MVKPPVEHVKEKEARKRSMNVYGFILAKLVEYYYTPFYSLYDAGKNAGALKKNQEIPRILIK